MMYAPFSLWATLYNRRSRNAIAFFSGNKLGLFVLTHEMQNAKCRMQNYDLLPFLRSNESGEPNGVEIFVDLKARGVRGHCPPN
jgi:hypothetical protein